MAATALPSINYLEQGHLKFESQAHQLSFTVASPGVCSLSKREGRKRIVPHGCSLSGQELGCKASSHFFNLWRTQSIGFATPAIFMLIYSKPWQEY